MPFLGVATIEVDSSGTSSAWPDSVVKGDGRLPFLGAATTEMDSSRTSARSNSVVGMSSDTALGSNNFDSSSGASFGVNSGAGGCSGSGDVFGAETRSSSDDAFGAGDDSGADADSGGGSDSGGGADSGVGVDSDSDFGSGSGSSSFSFPFPFPLPLACSRAALRISHIAAVLGALGFSFFFCFFDVLRAGGADIEGAAVRAFWRSV